MIRSVCFLLVAFISTAGVAQNRDVDHQFWLGASCKLDFKKGWALTTQVRARQINDLSTYYGTYLFLTGEYKVNKYLSGFLSYRYSSIANVGFYHRYALGLEGSLKVKRFGFFFRPMLQKQNQFFSGDDEQNTNASLYLRPRVQIKFRTTKRLDFYIYSEPFIDLRNTTRVDWWQNSLGLKYEYVKNQKINLFYIWSPDYKKKYVRTYNIFAVDWELTLKVGKRKIKERKGQAIEHLEEVEKQ